jgi:hypothetical protein
VHFDVSGICFPESNGQAVLFRFSVLVSYNAHMNASKFGLFTVGVGLVFLSGCPTDDPVLDVDTIQSPFDTNEPVEDTIQGNDTQVVQPDTASPSPDTALPDSRSSTDSSDTHIVTGCQSNADCESEMSGSLGPCQTPLCEDGKCVADTLPNGTSCDDGNPCTVGGTCISGQCSENPLVCNDGNACTDDQCDVVSGECTHPANMNPCNDGNPCTTSDTCSGGECDGTPAACPECSVDADCAEFQSDNLCLGSVHCLSGICLKKSNSVIDCWSIQVEPCEQALCNPATGECEVSTSFDGSPCEPLSKCESSGYCSLGQCLGTPTDCDDGDLCTADMCDVTSGCLHVPATGSECDDGDECTADDACINGACKGTLIVDCDDGDPCTTDSCDLNSGQCTYSFSSAACDDDDACTAGDHCEQGNCVAGPLFCNDQSVCTVDSCNSKNGCQFVTISCDDGDPCTVDSCDPVTGCQNALPGKACTSNSGCNDGLVCTQDICSTTCGSCLNKPIQCDDKNSCTQDACVEPTGCKVQPISGGTCDDGDECTTSDTCVGGECVGGNSTCAKGTQSSPATSCAEILATGNSNGDGVYYLKSSAEPGAFPVYCDMTTDGGGWIRVANLKAEVSVCTYVQAVGTLTDVATDTGSTGIMPLVLAQSLPQSSNGILVRIGAGRFQFKSIDPQFKWANVANGTISTKSVEQYSVFGSVNGGTSLSLQVPSSCVGGKGPCLLGGQKVTDGKWSVVLGIGSHKSGSFSQNAACQSTGAGVRGLYSGQDLAPKKWGSSGTIYIR